MYSVDQSEDAAPLIWFYLNGLHQCSGSSDEIPTSGSISNFHLGECGLYQFRYKSRDLDWTIGTSSSFQVGKAGSSACDQTPIYLFITGLLESILVRRDSSLQSMIFDSNIQSIYNRAATTIPSVPQRRRPNVSRELFKHWTTISTTCFNISAQIPNNPCSGGFNCSPRYSSTFKTYRRFANPTKTKKERTCLIAFRTLLLKHSRMDPIFLFFPSVFFIHTLIFIHIYSNRPGVGSLIAQGKKLLFIWENAHDFMADLQSAVASYKQRNYHECGINVGNIFGLIQQFREAKKRQEGGALPSRWDVTRASIQMPQQQEPIPLFNQIKLPSTHRKH